MKLTVFTLLILVTSYAYCQEHEGHNHPPSPSENIKTPDENSVTDTIPKHNHQSMTNQSKDTSVMDHSMHKDIPSILSTALPMNVNASGTAWHPRNSPMYMNLFTPGKWNLMLHYGVFAGYTAQNIKERDSTRGSNEFYLPSWFMLMGNRQVGKKGLFLVKAMISFDPFIMGGNGYPLLLQTGETYQGEPLIDRQHPHDLISELAIGYSHAFSESVDLFGYFGFPGEPAIGPPAFMHRPSSLVIPDSPLGHHWQDATHILFGVGTLGFRYKTVKLEGSIFTGREPDENRYGFDNPTFDSYSGRVSWLPTKSIAIQASAGYLKSPEVHEPENDVYRGTASVLHNYYFKEDKILSSAAVWGINHKFEAINPEHAHNAHSFLLELSLQMPKYTLAIRPEMIQKSFHELGIEDVENDEENLWISAFKVGGAIHLFKTKVFWTDLGAFTTLHIIDDDIKAYYGEVPITAEVFLRIIPARM